MKNVDGRLEYLLTKLRKQGHRITPQRMALLRLLTTSDDHLTAAQIHEKMRERFPTMSLATVYKTLNLLKEMGEVLELGFRDDDNRYDGSDPSPHPHLICIRCRKIIDLDMPEFGDVDQEIAVTSGFKILKHRLDFFGICPDCQEHNSE